jgi:hypothetical protein
MLVSIFAMKKWRNYILPKGAINISQNDHLNCTRSVRKNNHLNGFRHMKVIKHTRAKVKAAIGLPNKNSILIIKASPAKHTTHTTSINIAVYIQK